jgi:hypothetical protein
MTFDIVDHVLLEVDIVRLLKIGIKRLGLVEKNEENRFFVPWDEIDATFRLAA